MGLYLIELPDDVLIPYVRETEDGLLHGWGETPKREVVRCRDCKRWATEQRLTGACVGRDGRAYPDGFCAWGERRIKEASDDESDD